MSWTDRITALVAAGAIVATLSVGTCSTNGRFDDVNRRIDDAKDRFDGRFDDVNRRFDDVNRRFNDVNGRFDDVQTDIRELRSLVIEAIKTDTADDADGDTAAN